MARIVMSMGMSHSPMMALEGTLWSNFAANDHEHALLYDTQGNKVTYYELQKQVGDRYIAESKDEKLIELWEKMTRAFDRLRADVAHYAPDVMVVITNDHRGELFDDSNVPALSVFYGDEIVSFKKAYSDKYAPEVFEKMMKGLGLDANHVWPGESRVALKLISSLIEQGFDVGAMKEVKNPAQAAHGHGVGMVVTELMRTKLIPMVPVYVNTWPPNELTPSRCYDLGRALRKAIEEMPDDLRVAIVASGGLSHFVTDQDLDRHVLDALLNKSEEQLRNLPRHRLKAGSSEIRNWVVLGAASEHLTLDWHEYHPVFRTPSGTGIGMGFARWSSSNR